jgi:predicted alpha/beta superfamily hydrolase
MATSIPQPGIEVQSLHSEVINQDLQLHVKLPWNYAQSNAGHPVLFSLDANRDFPL